MYQELAFAKQKQDLPQRELKLERSKIQNFENEQHAIQAEQLPAMQNRYSLNSQLVEQAQSQVYTFIDETDKTTQSTPCMR